MPTYKIDIIRNHIQVSLSVCGGTAFNGHRQLGEPPDLMPRHNLLLESSNSRKARCKQHQWSKSICSSRARIQHVQGESLRYTSRLRVVSMFQIDKRGSVDK
ncbi:hypothetical protein FKM82_008222 [Ascaphus truei]